MTKVLVYTANYGGYDDVLAPCPQQLPPGVTMEYQCLTDETDPLPITGRLAGRFWKCLPPGRHDVSIWLDANIAVTSPTMVADLLGYLGISNMALWRHSVRDNIVDEMHEANRLPKYAEVAYVHEKLIENWKPWAYESGLWELHAMVRRYTRLQEEMGLWWWRHTVAASRPGPGGVVLDQIQLPHLLRHFEIEPAVIPGSVWTNDWWSSTSRHAHSSPEHP